MMTNKQLIQLRPITMYDFTEVLTWSKDDTFCLANGWETNRDKQELNEWWTHCVTNKATNFKRLGIEEGNRLVGYVDLACIEGNSAEFGIAIGNRDVWGKGRKGIEHYLGMDSALVQYEMIFEKGIPENGNMFSKTW